MRSKVLFIGFLLILCITLSCKKKKSTYYISQKLKEFCFFTSPSFWIYKNDFTGAMDSCFVSGPPIVHFFDDTRWIEERIEIPIQSNFFSSYNMLHQCPPADNPDYDSDRLNLWMIESNGDQGNIFALWFSNTLIVEQPDPCDCPVNNCFYYSYEVIPDYVLGNNEFFNVLHTHYRTQDTTATYPYAFSFDFYFAKNIGLIHFRENDPLHNAYRSYTILRWNVKQNDEFKVNKNYNY